MNKIIQHIIGILFSAIFFLPIIQSDQFVLINLPRYFYFYFILTLLISASVGNLFFKKQDFILKLNLVDLAIVLIFLYATLHGLFKEGAVYSNNKYLFQCGLFGLYAFIRSFPIKLNGILIVYLIIGLLISAGLHIFKGIQQIYYSDFTKASVTGYFDNSGPFTNFLSVIGCFSICLFLLKSNWGLYRSFILVISISSFVLIAILISRTAWIAALIGLLYVFEVRYNLWRKLKKNIFDTYFKKIGSIVFAISSLVLVGYYLYNVKKDSADGRVFIWQNTFELIKGKPFFGYGVDSYMVKYNDQQAIYFSTNEQDEGYSKIADNNQFAFNDLLQVGVELGVLGFTLYLFLFVSIFYITRKIDPNKSENIYPFKTGILVLLVCSFFSYPFQQFSTQIIFYCFLGVLSSNDENYFIIYKPLVIAKRIALVVIFILLLANLKMQYNRFDASKKWKIASDLSKQGDFDKAFVLYKQVYSDLKYNGYYLFNFGAEMSINNKPEESIVLLKKANSKVNSSDLHIYLGNSYEQINDIENAEKEFIKASYIVPNRFYPKYRLVKLYEKNGDSAKVICLAKSLMSQNVKIPSNIVFQIKDEMKNIIGKYEPK